MTMLSITRRLSGSLPASKTNKHNSCPPQQIILDPNAKPIQDVERQIERRCDKDEIEYLKDVVSKEQEKVEMWKGVANKMKSEIEYLECRVSSLENEHDASIGNIGSSHDDGGGGDCHRRSSSPSSSASTASLRRVSTSSSSSSQASLRLSTSSNPQSSSPPPSSPPSPQHHLHRR